MVISVLSNSPMWSFEASEQQISFPNEIASQAIIINSDANSLPHMEIRPKELKTIDLYFRLPVSETSEKTLPAFDFHWQLHAGSVLVRESTSFERIATPRHYLREVYPYEPYPYDVGWGPYWWPAPRPLIRVRVR